MAGICQLSALPVSIAEHMATTLLREYPRFVRAHDGLWRVREAAGPRWRADSDFDLLSDLSFAVVDLEATGGSATSGDRITEVGIVIVRGGEIERSYERLVNPQRAIPSFVARLTRITWELVRTEPTFRDLSGEIVDQLAGHVFVAHNANFDWRFLNAELSRVNGQVLTGRRLCTVRLARCLLPQLRSRSLDGLSHHYGVEIPPENRHRAGGDALAAAKCLIRLMEDARGRGCERWSDLEDLLASRRIGGRRRRKRRPSAMPGPVSKDTTA